jgi:hypothetical protein
MRILELVICYVAVYALKRMLQLSCVACGQSGCTGINGAMGKIIFP